MPHHLCASLPHSHLAANPHLERPYKAELMAAQSSDAAQVVRDVVLGPCPTPLLVLKHMAKQVTP